MEKKICEVVLQTDVSYVPSQKAEGGQVAMCGIKLKEFGGKFGDEFACTMFGNLAQCRFYENELVVAALRFVTHEYEGRIYQDVVVENIVKLNR